MATSKYLRIAGLPVEEWTPTEQRGVLLDLKDNLSSLDISADCANEVGAAIDGRLLELSDG